MMLSLSVKFKRNRFWRPFSKRSVGSTKFSINFSSSEYFQSEFKSDQDFHAALNHFHEFRVLKAEYVINEKNIDFSSWIVPVVGKSDFAFVSDLFAFEHHPHQANTWYRRNLPLLMYCLLLYPWGIELQK